MLVIDTDCHLFTYLIVRQLRTEFAIAECVFRVAGSEISVSVVASFGRGAVVRCRGLCRFTASEVYCCYATAAWDIRYVRHLTPLFISFRQLSAVFVFGVEYF